MNFYSITLLIATMACCGAAIFLAIGRFRANPRALRICALMCYVAIAFNLVSFLVHFFHNHYSPSLKMQDFLAQHPSFLILTFTTIILYLLSMHRGRARNVE